MIDQLHQRWYTKLVFNLLYSGDLSVLDSNWNRTGSDLVLVGHCCAVSIGSVRVLGGLSNNHSCGGGGGVCGLALSIASLQTFGHIHYFLKSCE